MIIGSAPVDEAERCFIGTQVSPEDFLVCADGGYETARRLGLKPDLLIGDLDPVRKIFRRISKRSAFRCIRMTRI